MTDDGQLIGAYEHSPVTICALRSLTPQALDAVGDAVRDLPGRWTLERHEDYDGYLSLLVSPEDDCHRSTYLISGKIGDIELARFEDEQLHALARFEDIDATAAELVRLLKQFSAPK
jgi:hypothetical protein